MQVPFVDLKAQTKELKQEVMAAIEEVVDSAHFCLGPHVEALEREFAGLCGVRYGVALNTGTSALQLALQAVGVGPGDEVITVPMTFVASAAAVHYLGARPVFVDVDPRRYTLDPARLESAINPRTKAILPVHLYGQPADMDPILEIAARHQIPVIEDACQAHLACYKGKTVGSLGRAGAISFYPGKNLGAFGEGGLLVTDDPAIAQQARILRDWGQAKKYHHEVAGYNFRMDAIQGAVLGVKLRHLVGWNTQRQRLAERYDRLLQDLPLTLPYRAPDSTHIYHIYAVLADDRETLQTILQQRGVQTGIHYPIPVHLQKAYNDCNYKPGDFPVAEGIARRTLSLPMYPEMSDDQQDFVVESLTHILGAKAR